MPMPIVCRLFVREYRPWRIVLEKDGIAPGLGFLGEDQRWQASEA